MTLPATCPPHLPTPTPEEHPLHRTTVLDVTGMTCHHCVRAVVTEVAEIDGVLDVEVALRAGELSEVTVTSETALDPADLRAAVDEAGYTVAAIR